MYFYNENLRCMYVCCISDLMQFSPERKCPNNGFGQGELPPVRYIYTCESVHHALYMCIFPIVKRENDLQHPFISPHAYIVHTCTNPFVCVHVH